MERERNEIGYKANSQYWCLTAGHSTGNVSMTTASSAIVLRVAVHPFLICKASHTWSKMGHHGHFAVKNAVLRWKICWLSTAIVTRFRAKKSNYVIWIGHHFTSYILIACTKRPLSMTGNDSMPKCMTGQHANDSMAQCMTWHAPRVHTWARLVCWCCSDSWPRLPGCWPPPLHLCHGSVVLTPPTWYCVVLTVVSLPQSSLISFQ